MSVIVRVGVYAITITISFNNQAILDYITMFELRISIYKLLLNFFMTRFLFPLVS